MTDIAILGASGRMGRVLASIISERKDCCVVAGIDTHTPDGCTFPVYSSLIEMTEKPDVLIDFSHPDATKSALQYCKENNLPIVVCTTGFDDTTKTAIAKTSDSVAVFHSANMSLGINLLQDLVQRAQAILEGYDIEIIEKHHNNKLDAPSGTALMLADSINEGSQGRYSYVYERQSVRKKRDSDEIGIHAVRGGSIVGEHDVIFAGPNEVITLSHNAYSRDVFANGAVAAALFLHGKNAGLYSMKDVIHSK